MAIGKITKRSVDAMSRPPEGKIDFLRDTELKGFICAILPSGTRTFYCEYKHNGRTRRVKIGSYGRTTADAARSTALRLLAEADAGEDPAALKKASRAVPTFKAVAERWMVEHVASKCKPRTATGYRSFLDNHVLPAIGTKRLDELNEEDVAKLHGALSKTPHTANRAVATISSTWAWAAKRKEFGIKAADNPTVGFGRYEEKTRDRYLTTEEMGRLGATLRLADGEGLPLDDGGRAKMGPYITAAIRLLIFTGARVREILDLQWRHVDMERGLLLLPDSKTGAKTIVLSKPALEILATLPRLAGSKHVIPGRAADGTRHGIRKPWAIIRKHADLEGVRLHDLRHSFASVGAGASLGLPMIGKLLGHATAAVTQRYAHLDADPLRRAADIIAGSIADAMCATNEQEKQAVTSKRGKAAARVGSRKR